MQTDDVGKIANAVGKVVLDIQTQINNAPGASEKFPTPGGDLYKIKIDLNSLQKNNLLNGKLMISLYPYRHKPISYPRSYYVFANALKITIDGVLNYSGFITHLGPSRFEPIHGKLVTFRTIAETRTITQEPINLGAGVSELSSGNWISASDTEYLGLSPFSDWLIEINNPGSIPNLNSAKFVTLEFQGSMRTFA